MSITKTYPSKISYGIFIPLTLLGIAIVALPFIKGELYNGTLGFIITSLIFLPFILFTRYKITDAVLNVKSSFLVNTSIDIANIHLIRSNKSFLAAPALSLDRIEILYNKYDAVVISPKNKEEFLTDLKQINPNIVIEL